MGGNGQDGLRGEGFLDAGAALVVEVAELGPTTLIFEPSACFNSAFPDRTCSTVEELIASSLTREFRAIVARLLSAK
jgi:hypothetical protein